MNVPSAWRPLRIRGGWRSGTMLLGDGADVIVQLKWWHPGGSRFDPERWIRRRLRKMRADSRTAMDPPAPAGFQPVALAPVRGAASGQVRSLWYGYSETARLVLEVAIGAAASGQIMPHASVLRALQSLHARGPSAPKRYAVFGTSFEVPARFELRRHSLLLGDQTMAFSGRRAETLTLRQVYPAGLALSRADLPQWLRSLRSDRYRRYRARGPVQPFPTHDGSLTLDGSMSCGRRRLPFPLGWVRPRISICGAVHDERTERLLLAQYDGAPGAIDIGTETVTTALLKMNRPGVDAGEECQE